MAKNPNTDIFNAETSSPFVFDNFAIRRSIFMRFRSSDLSISGDEFFIS